MKKSKQNTETYTIQQIYKIDYIAMDFLYDAGHKLNNIFSQNYDFSKIDLQEYADNNRIVICRKGETVVGVMLSRLSRAIFDPTTILYVHDTLYTTRPKATSLLLRDFIDFGKLHADHIITMTTPHTNIKGRSLERLGFKELETFYRMETKR